MAGQRVCSECGKPLPEDASAARKTCSGRCRQLRSRRIKRARQRGGKVPLGGEEHEHREIQDMVRGETQDVSRKAMIEELRPIIREQITDEVVAALHDMVGLTPAIVRQLEKDVESSDPVIRQKAYGLVMRYLLGTEGRAAAGQEKHGSLIVQFGSMPQPAQPAIAEPEDEPALDLRECETCHQFKALDEFDGPALRCNTCQSERKADVLERYGA